MKKDEDEHPWEEACELSALGPRGVAGSADSAGGGRAGLKMEGNRDEAEKCIHIATKALQAGDKEKALKFLNKAEKLYPTSRAKGEGASAWTSERR